MVFLYNKNEKYLHFDGIHRMFNTEIAFNKGIVKYNYIKQIAMAYRKSKLDFHFVFSAQNGVGKSYTALTLAKYINPEFDVKEDIIYSYHDYDYLINKIRTSKDKVIMIDEANRFFYYLKHQAKKQTELMQTIEICRANRNIFIPCVRDARKLDYNYRNGKVNMINHLFDRTKKQTPIGFILQGQHMFENEDKFLLSRIPPTNSIETLCKAVEKLPTFRGYFKGEHINRFNIDVELYEKLKDKQMLAQTDRYTGTNQIKHDGAFKKVKIDEI